MWFKIDKESIDLFINVRPASSKNEIVGVFNDILKIKIKAPAVDGAANKELIKFLSKKFKIPKSEIIFVFGEKSKRKSIRLPRSEQIELWIEEMHK
jgi:uncharacterized protein (TIGR00251 family)